MGWLEVAGVMTAPVVLSVSYFEWRVRSARRAQQPVATKPRQPMGFL